MDSILLRLQGLFIVNLDSKKFDIGIVNIRLIDGHDLFEPNLKVAKIVNFNVTLFVLQIQV